MEQSDIEDEQWLKVLAGEKVDADPLLMRQAEAVRRALKAYQSQVNAREPVADDRQLQRLLFRLRFEHAGKRQEEDLSHYEVQFSRKASPSFSQSSDVLYSRIRSDRALIAMRGSRSRAWWVLGLAASTVILLASLVLWNVVMQRAEMAQHAKMKSCNAQAKDMRGDARNKFMSECLKN